jgi:hypothetical protein
MRLSQDLRCFKRRWGSSGEVSSGLRALGRDGVSCSVAMAIRFMELQHSRANGLHPRKSQ